MNPNLLVVLPYCTKDAAQAKTLLEWIRDLGSVKDFSAMLAADRTVPRETITELRDLAKSIFGFSETILVDVAPDNQGWPKGANIMFAMAAKQVEECYKQPFLWLEPDCVPLKDSWLYDLADAYWLCPKKFMGPIVVSQQAGVPPQHMAGVAIYPQNTYSLLKNFLNSSDCFDIASAHFVCSQSRAMDTKLIYHLWGSHGVVPTFRAVKLNGDPANVLTPSIIPKEAVLFHRTKDAGLINLLRYPTLDDAIKAGVSNGLSGLSTAPVFDDRLISKELPAQEPPTAPDTAPENRLVNHLKKDWEQLGPPDAKEKAQMAAEPVAAPKKVAYKPKKPVAQR